MHERRSSGVRSYFIGLGLALLLTAIAFGVVHFRLADGTTAILIIAGTAVLQILVHLRWFLFASGTAPRDHLLALAFAAFLIFVMVGGSLWIMTDLAHRMM